MHDVQVLDSPSAATLALDPIKGRMLAELGEPASAAAIASRVGLTRQQANYHLKALEAQGLVEPAGERRWGGIRERLLRASAASYVVSPAAMGPLASDPARTVDRLSASFLVAVAARIVREVGALWQRARAVDKRLATLTIDTAVRFRSPADASAFATELSQAIATLAARYHDESAPKGRTHRVIVASYPAPAGTTPSISTATD